MTLAFSLGLSVGYRRTLAMMLGEMVGVALVVTVSLLALAWLLALNPVYLNALALIGGVYLLWIAWQLWHAHSHFQRAGVNGALSVWGLATLGFTTAVMNPKGWAFMLALLPGFVDVDKPLGAQLLWFLLIMMTTEFLSMSLYASGGKMLAKWLGRDSNLALLNKTAAVLMVMVSVWVFAF